MLNLTQIVSLSDVIPVITLWRVEHAVEIAKVLVDTGVRVMEVTLRSEPALHGIESIRSQVPDMCVGAGTVWSKENLLQAARAGAQFAVSPSTTDELLAAESEAPIPLLHGAQTIGEMARLVLSGRNPVKFFPAEAAGGIAMVQAVNAVLPAARLCPTGGLTAARAANYLPLRNVACVGASGLVPDEVVRGSDWMSLEKFIRDYLKRLRRVG